MEVGWKERHKSLARSFVSHGIGTGDEQFLR